MRVYAIRGYSKWNDAETYAVVTNIHRGEYGPTIPGKWVVRATTAKPEMGSLSPGDDTAREWARKHLFSGGYMPQLNYEEHELVQDV